ncbi:MAG: type II toxin-antitoxin system RelE/ParE family toxin [Deltaproteobacteria bacterium]|nr:type II toxin-antitoxin system RelE/ParE family toxin [Deltaproteobacteria bacterium]
MARLIWAEPALMDLDAIADYIALDKPDTAHKFAREVFSRVGRLRRFPRMGSIPPEIP